MRSGRRGWIIASSLALMSPFCSDCPAQGILFEMRGSYDGQVLGERVCPAGDANQDGFDDFVALSGDGHGRLNVFSGREGFSLSKIAPGAPYRFTTRPIRFAGDVNADGFPDIIASLRNATDPIDEHARVYSLKDGSVLHVIHGTDPLDEFANSMSSAGDVNHDGHDDLLIGAPTDFSPANPTGNAQVWSGLDGKRLYLFRGDNLGDLLGYSVDCAGDVNLDGFPDLAVGATEDGPSWKDREGYGRVYSGRDGSTLLTIHGSVPNGRTGVCVAGPGDVNGDGHADILIGQWRGGPDATLYSGRDGSLLYSLPRVSVSRCAVDGVGDLDDDGCDDLVVGYSATAQDPPRSGALIVHSGRDGTILREFQGANKDDRLGYSVAGLGDVNADGRPDIIQGTGYPIDPQRRGLITVYGWGCTDVVEYGDGCPGSGGFIPRLSFTGCPAPGSIINVRIENGPGGLTIAQLMLGDNASALALGGGCELLLFPIMSRVPLLVSGSGPGDGAVSVTGTIPQAFPPGPLYLQALIPDPGGFKGYTLTQGLGLEIQ